MTANIVLVNTAMLVNILAFLLPQNMIYYICFDHRLNDFRNFGSPTEKTKPKRKISYNNTEKLYNTLLTI